MPHILSLQSHVAYGYVGNRAAIFPLERMGFETIVINSVQFSNHTGYGAWTGMVFPPEHIASLFEGIAARHGYADCAAMLTGYLGDAAVGDVALQGLAKIRHASPGALYCCDPVMGDIGRGFFVKPDIQEFFRHHAVPAATILTPNAFELAALVGHDVHTLDDVLAATATLRAKGPRWILVTSWQGEAVDPDKIGLLLDSPEGAFLVETPRLHFDIAPNGAGDCTASMFLGHLLNTGDAVAAVARTASAIYSVFEMTARLQRRELALIQAQDALAESPAHFAPRQVGIARAA